MAKSSGKKGQEKEGKYDRERVCIYRMLIYLWNTLGKLILKVETNMKKIDRVNLFK